MSLPTKLSSRGPLVFIFYVVVLLNIRKNYCKFN